MQSNFAMKLTIFICFCALAICLTSALSASINERVGIDDSLTLRNQFIFFLGPVVPEFDTRLQGIWIGVGYRFTTSLNDYISKNLPERFKSYTGISIGGASCCDASRTTFFVRASLETEYHVSSLLVGCDLALCFIPKTAIKESFTKIFLNTNTLDKIIQIAPSIGLRIDRTSIKISTIFPFGKIISREYPIYPKSESSPALSVDEYLYMLNFSVGYIIG